MAERVAVVTGAFGALGRVTVQAAIEAGYRVAALDYAAEPSAGLAGAILVLGGVDLADPAATEAAIGEVVDRFGRLDVLFNIAGGFIWQTLENGDAEAWTRMHRLNLMTALNASRVALPHLLAAGAGRIINIGANAALRADAGMGAYAASKAAVHRLTESLAAELKGRGVTVNAVLPSIIDTPANRADMPAADFSLWVTPADLAAVMLFLAGNGAGAVTGALIPVTGGL
ncbi:MAG: SDR family NAD(P)-dependent oxidoreductase [Reyranella sp.]|jgi:NAD(P)-dependent dehydrogenase (short-subunit alcohol dehydrogenase family)|nr:SDR family NAD(P)-dependent oxidoreductase [Reyranella sp.]